MSTAAPDAAATPAPISPAAHLPDQFTVESAELRAEVLAHTPLRFTPAGEPYLPLPAPFERFYLGAMRQSDLPHDVSMMNDLRVVRTIHGPPFPNPLINAQRWLVRERATVVALLAANAEGNFRPAASSPFNVLRERKPDGSEEYVGQVTLGPMGPNAKRATPINNAWEDWRSPQVFEIGAALRPEYHGKGIASAAVRLLLEEWAVPQMGCTEIHAQAFVSNVASVKLWEKHGFVEEPSRRGVVQVPEAKGGGVEPDCVLVFLRVMKL
ncbi:acyl-CoA N-acyltransferase [Mycena galopus ATCC 62051]|nr:acyl-CoA N-acyltransferase [Mycena galopus ATCC 62051]